MIIMDVNKDEVCIFIPTLNEAPTIESLILSFKEMGYGDILVMDGRSTDKTVEIAKAAGAKVKIQSGKGKGQAIIEAIEEIDKPYILMLDGDGTYVPADAERMLAPLFANDADQVIGNRLDTFEPGALSKFNHFGNQVINYLFKVTHGEYLGDILSGYRAFKTESIKEMDLKEKGFEIETEISVQSVANRQKTVIVPVAYKPRPGTPTKLHPVRDGAKIIFAIWRLAKVSNPMFYFGLIGLTLAFLGLLSGIFVLYEWFRSVVHTELAILTVLLITLGFQIFMFGVLADMFLASNRELKREIQRLKRN